MDNVVAHELAQWGMWVSPRSKELFKHYTATKARKGFVEARYAQFLVRSHVSDWIKGYFEGCTYFPSSRSEKSMAARLWIELANLEIERNSRKDNV